MYVPTLQIEERFGTDPQPLGDYINALKARAEAILAAAEPPPAKGLLVAVGLKTNRRSKVWCQAIDGSMPTALIKTLERELGDVEPVALKSGPAGLGLKFGLNGQEPADSVFPQSPSAGSTRPRRPARSRSSRPTTCSASSGLTEGLRKGARHRQNSADYFPCHPRWPSRPEPGKAHREEREGSHRTDLPSDDQSLATSKGQSARSPRSFFPGPVSLALFAPLR
jgi:hypothetical protein